MPAIFEIYDPTTLALTLDLGDRVAQWYGSGSTGGALTGSFTDTKLIGRTAMAFALSNTSVDSVYGGPDITVNATTGVVSWSYAGTVSGFTPPATERDHTIYWGHY